MNHLKKLRSIPFKFLISEWLRIRNLELIDENHFSIEIEQKLKELNLLKKEGGFFFGDLKEFKLFLIVTNKENLFSENQVQDYLNELKDFLISCGRKEEDVIFIKYPFGNLETQYLANTKILFLIIAKSEKPFFESLLGGEIKKNIKSFLNHKHIVKEAFDPFYSIYKNHQQKIPLLFIKKIYKKENLNRVYKLYIKKFLENHKYVIFIVGFEREDFNVNYFKNLIDYFVYSDRPVLRFEEALKNHTLNSKLSIILLELRFDCLWKGIFYNSTSIFVKKNKIHFLPEYVTKKKYIKLANALEEDFWILIPEKKEINSSIKEAIMPYNPNSIIKNFDLNLYFLLSLKRNQSEVQPLNDTITYSNSY